MTQVSNFCPFFGCISCIIGTCVRTEHTYGENGLNIEDTLGVEDVIVSKILLYPCNERTRVMEEQKLQEQVKQEWMQQEQAQQEPPQQELTGRYQAAVDSFVDKIKSDPNIIAIILCGSLAYDQVWEKSDIDMTVVVRDQQLKNYSYCILEDDITINVSISPRSGFKRTLEGQCGGSFLHSYMAKGRIIYSTDDSLYEYFEEYKEMGNDDIASSVFYSACELIHCYDKAQKWLTVKKDPLYSQYYLLKAAEVIARMEVCLSGESPSREAILKAYKLNPHLITPYYHNAMSHYYSQEELQAAIDGIDAYLEQQLEVIKKPVLEYMADQEMKTVTMITMYFRTESHFIVGIFDYLAEKGVILKISQTIRITPKSKLAVEEIAYQCPQPGGFGSYGFK